MVNRWPSADSLIEMGRRPRGRLDGPRFEPAQHLDCGHEVSVVRKDHGNLALAAKCPFHCGERKLYVHTLLARRIVGVASIAERTEPWHNNLGTLFHPRRSLAAVSRIPLLVIPLRRQPSVNVHSDELPFRSTVVPSSEKPRELERAVVAVLVRIVAPSERLACGLVCVLPVDEDGDWDHSGHQFRIAPPVRPEPDGGEQCLSLSASEQGSKPPSGDWHARRIARASATCQGPHTARHCSAAGSRKPALSVLSHYPQPPASEPRFAGLGTD